jgi:hypothetical protein
MTKNKWDDEDTAKTEAKAIISRFALRASFQPSQSGRAFGPVCFGTPEGVPFLVLAALLRQA